MELYLIRFSHFPTTIFNLYFVPGINQIIDQSTGELFAVNNNLHGMIIPGSRLNTTESPELIGDSQLRHLYNMP